MVGQLLRPDGSVFATLTDEGLWEQPDGIKEVEDWLNEDIGATGESPAEGSGPAAAVRAAAALFGLQIRWGTIPESEPGVVY